MMSRRLALVLRGPMGVGKSAVAAYLADRLGSGQVVVLDHGWGAGEFRYNGGMERYRDIRGRSEDVLIVELGCGEPGDLSFRGATRNAGEWMQILRDDGREIKVFRLSATWESVQTRMQRRPHDSMMIAAFWFSAYAINHDMVRFPDSPAVPETLIETTGQDISHVAQSILVHVCAR